MSNEDNEYPRLYDLTDLTGKRRNADRKTMRFGFETSQRAEKAVMGGIIASVPLLAITAPFLGLYSIVVSAVLIPALSAAFMWRSQSFGENAIKQLYIRSKDTPGVVFIAGQPVTFEPVIGRYLYNNTPPPPPALARTRWILNKGHRWL